MNIVGVLGKIITEPQVRPVGSSKVTNFLISVRGAGNWSKEDGKATFGSFNVEAWGKLADLITTHCEKGTTISLSGSLKQDTWKDDTGNRERVKIVMTSFQFVNSDQEQFLSLEDGSTSEDTIDPFEV